MAKRRRSGTKYTKAKCLRTQVAQWTRDMVHDLRMVTGRKTGVPKRLRAAVRAYARKLAPHACGERGHKRGWV